MSQSLRIDARLPNTPAGKRLYLALERIAKREDRSIASVVRRACEELAARDGKS